MSRMIPGRTDHVCQRHYKMLSKEGPPRQKHARAVRQRSGRFVAWEKVNLSGQLPAPPDAEALAIEGAPASGEEMDRAPLVAPAGRGSKLPGASKAKQKGKRTKRKARAFSPGEEEVLLVAGMDEDAHPSACEGEAGDARQSESVGAEGMEGGPKKPASATRQPPSRRGRSRRDAEGSQSDMAARADKAESTNKPSPSRRQRNPSRGSQTVRPKAHSSAANSVQEAPLVQSTGPPHKKGAVRVVESRRSTRKRKA